MFCPPVGRIFSHLNRKIHLMHFKCQAVSWKNGLGFLGTQVYPLFVDPRTQRGRRPGRNKDTLWRGRQVGSRKQDERQRGYMRTLVESNAPRLVEVSKVGASWQLGSLSHPVTQGRAPQVPCIPFVPHTLIPLLQPDPLKNDHHSQ